MKSKVYLYLVRAFTLISLMLLLESPIAKVACAQEPWVALMFWPQANTNSSHEIFLNDFETMVKTLKSKGVNTIVFDMNHWGYHFTSDIRLNSYPYSPSWGFTSDECRRMAEITRANGLQIVVALQILTHSVGGVFNYCYPEYMLPAKPWQQGISYQSNTYVQYNGKTYRSATQHVSDASNAPPASAYWLPVVTSDTRDPFNKAGEAVIFKMIDELITTFTVNGIKPEGFHICSDELNTWYDNPIATTGKTSAQIYAMAINNAFIHIKSKNSSMEVIMWSDMLDRNWNGAPIKMNTAEAINMIPRDIIIADWRYETNKWYRYDSVKELFPSVGEFLDKGFRVWPTSWNEVKGTSDLVWTGNIEQLRTGKIMGHLYSTWLGGIVPELDALLSNPAYQVPDTILAGVPETEKPLFRQYYRNLADSITGTSTQVGIKQCRGNEFHCGPYPKCEDNHRKDGFYAGQYRKYYCSNNMNLYDVMNPPNDYVGYWKFNGDASDVTGRSNGTFIGSSVVTDKDRGQVSGFVGIGDYIRIKNTEWLNMGTGSLSIGAWFKAGASSGLGTIASKSHDLASYTLFLHQDGRVLFETNGNNFFRYSANGVNNRDNKWHHVLAVFDSGVPTINIYIDGTLSNGSSSLVNGTNSKTSASDLLIGNHNGYGEYQFVGTLDDLMLFNRALTPVEVKMIYLSQKTSLLYESIDLKPIK